MKKAVYDESLGAGEEGGPSFLPALIIRNYASPMDVEELRTAAEIDIESSSRRWKYVALRHSDHALHVCDDVNCKVPLQLQRVFDFEIVSFSPLHSLGGNGEAIGILGAVDMLNAGGAVLSARVVASSDNADMGTEVELLGSGKYWVLVIGLSPAMVGGARIRASQVFEDGETNNSTEVAIEAAVLQDDLAVTWLSSAASDDHPTAIVLEIRVPKLERTVESNVSLSLQRTRMSLSFTPNT